MATTYSENSELVLMNGMAIIDPLNGFFISNLTTEQKNELLDAARLKAYNEINDVLDGQVSIPATSILSLKQIEIDLVFSYFIRDSFVLENFNTSEWQDKYEQSIKLLENLVFDASNDEPVADSENVGNGTLTVHALNNEFTKTETWIFTAQNATRFSVYGTKTGNLPTLTVDVRYPEKEWDSYSGYGDYGIPSKSMMWVEFPFYVTINSGNIDFVANDKFTLQTYSASDYHSTVERLRLA